MDSLSELKIDLRQMIIAIETTVDLVGMNDTNHAKRVAYIASQIAHKLGFSEEDNQYVFELGLLHDCGVSTEQMHSNLVNHFDWEDAHIHCEIGYNLLKSFKPLRKFAIPVLHHHTAFNKLKKLNLTERDANMANLIFLADRIDVTAAAHYETDILLARDSIVKNIKEYSGTYFDPNIIEAFLSLERSEAFWIALEDRHISRFTWDMGQFETSTVINMSQLKQLSLIIAYIVDQKSPFTAQHSARVGSLAKYIASRYGLSDEQCQKIEIAGFLHDIGKLRTPDNILQKPGKLTKTERSIMDQHSYETFEILRHVKGLEDISIWAAFHHEGLNGTGYPFHPKEKDLSIEARIIAVADIFQALVQDRPYRGGMSLDNVLSIIYEYVDIGKLDESVVKVIEKDSQKCFDIAKGEAEENKDSERPIIPWKR
ncbi:MAG: HD domain-containing protein [Thiovulaceae bacterium]|nr:HD domain-containing protein [Sulfurimonadaceae bacterium]